ncbi:MAG: TIR domain-containing protein [candidate division Zixibacteria bacterium]|nr:TIR domain-containing protein [candidate division Zixibacteria bacterium]
MPKKRKIFISYAREDGDKHAKIIYEKLKNQFPDGAVWLDRFSMKGGEGWWKQIAEAIDKSEYLILVITEKAISSENVREEWFYARRQGVCVCPIMPKKLPKQAMKKLPRWMSKSHIYDLNDWDRILGQLNSSCQVTKVPFMAEKPREYINRSKEYNLLLESLLDRTRQSPVVITTVLKGAGGFGKTTLAQALCYDDEVIAAYDDGILWVTLGENPDILSKLRTLYSALTGEMATFVDEHEAANHLSEKLKGKDCLIVIDDVWHRSHLAPFTRNKDDCSYLITTRYREIVEDAKAIPVDEMTSDEAIDMLISGLSPQPMNLQPFGELAERMGEWPLLLGLAGSALKVRVKYGETVDAALSYLNNALDKKGITAFDRRDAEQRQDAVALTVEASLNLLEDDEINFYIQLGIFPEDIDIPIKVVSELWGIDEFDAEELLLRLHELSLIQKLDLKSRTIRLHDVMRDYLIAKSDKPAETHNKLVKAWGDLYDLPHKYAWQWLAHHLSNAKKESKLRELLIDFNWLKAKLDAADVNSLVSDYDYIKGDSVLTSIQATLRLASHILADKKDQLNEQLLGRLLEYKEPEIQGLLRQAKRKKGVWLRPIKPCLTSPGTGEIRTLSGHSGSVSAVAVTPDGRFAISGSDDETLKVWDITSGEELHTLSGHSDRICTVISTSDGRFAISGSRDETLKVWDINSGEELRTLSGHSGSVSAVAVTLDGRFAISGSGDETLKVWDIESGEELRTLSWHRSGVSAVAVTSNGRLAISGSWDKTLKIWDITNGDELRTLSGHRSAVKTVALTSDGRLAISGSMDETLKVWDIESGEELRTLSRHSHWINAVAVTSDGRFAISGSNDNTLKVWDIRSGDELRTLLGHSNDINAVAVTSDGRLAISGSEDKTLKIWDVSDNARLQKKPKLSDFINDVIVPSDGRYAISRSFNNSVKVWNIISGQESHALSMDDDVISVAIASNKQVAITQSVDNTLKAWNIKSGEELRMFSKFDDISAIAMITYIQYAISGADISDLIVWDITSGEEPRIFRGNSETTAVASTSNGGLVISGYIDSTLKIWDMTSGEVLYTLSGHNSSVMALAITSDDCLAISGSSDNIIKIWDISSGEELRTLSGHKRRITELVISSNDQFVISVSDDCTLKVWDIASGKELQTFSGHNDRIDDVAVTTDNRFVISSSYDRTFKVWDIKSGKNIARFYADAAITCHGLDTQQLILAAATLTGQILFLKLENLEKYG